jgi:hypothetical protein
MATILVGGPGCSSFCQGMASLFFRSGLEHPQRMAAASSITIKRNKSCKTVSV